MQMEMGTARNATKAVENAQMKGNTHAVFAPPTIFSKIAFVSSATT